MVLDNRAIRLSGNNGTGWQGNNADDNLVPPTPAHQRRGDTKLLPCIAEPLAPKEVTDKGLRVAGWELKT